MSCQLWSIPTTHLIYSNGCHCQYYQCTNVFTGHVCELFTVNITVIINIIIIYYNNNR